MEILIGALLVVCIIIFKMSSPRPTKVQNINRAINQLDRDVANLRNKYK